MTHDSTPDPADGDFDGLILSGPPGPVSLLSVAPLPAGTAAERYLVTGSEDLVIPAEVEVLPDRRYQVRPGEGEPAAGTSLMCRIALAVDAYRARHGHAGEWRPLSREEIRAAIEDAASADRSEPAALGRAFGGRVRLRGGQWETAVRNRDILPVRAGAIRAPGNSSAPPARKTGSSRPGRGRAAPGSARPLR